MALFRTRVHRLTLTVMLVFLTLVTVLIYAGLSALLSDHIDSELLAFAQHEADEMAIEDGALIPSEHPMQEADHVAVVMDQAGVILWKRADVVERPPLDAFLLAEVQRGHAVYDTLALPNGDSVRRISVPVTLAGARSAPYILQAEMSVRLVQETLRLLMLLLAGLAVAMAVVAWIGSRWLARQALLPVEILSATAERISVPSLTTRVTLNAPYEEFERLARLFNAMLERLHRAFEGQRRFIADAAHEIKTPLAVLKGTIEVALHKSRSADDYREVLVTSWGQVERLNALTRSLLTLAEFAGDRPPITPAPLALAPLLQGLITQLTVLAEDRRVRLTLDAQPVPLVMGDDGRLTQLLVNLLDNALAHTPPGGAVTVQLRLVNGQVVMAVADTGPGIAPEHRPHLFERFYRGDSARARESGGAGLGLAIVKEIAEAHGGTVHVDSAVGTGSVFTVTLPPYTAP